MNDLELICRALDAAEFAYPVAVHPGMDPDLGAVLDVHAFDVPEGDAVRISFELTQIVRACRLTAVPLVGCYDTVESDEERARLPLGVHWLRPALRVPVLPHCKVDQSDLRATSVIDSFWARVRSGVGVHAHVLHSAHRVSVVEFVPAQAALLRSVTKWAIHKGSLGVMQPGVSAIHEGVHYSLAAANAVEWPTADPVSYASNTHYSLGA